MDPSGDRLRPLRAATIALIAATLVGGAVWELLGLARGAHGVPIPPIASAGAKRGAGRGAYAALQLRVASPQTVASRPSRLAQRRMVVARPTATGAGSGPVPPRRSRRVVRARGPRRAGLPAARRLARRPALADAAAASASSSAAVAAVEFGFER